MFSCFFLSITEPNLTTTSTSESALYIVLIPLLENWLCHLGKGIYREVQEKVYSLQEKCYVYRKSVKFRGKNPKFTEKYANFAEK